MNLCIPRIDSNIKKEYIYERLSNIQVGKIERIIEIPLKNDATYKRILFRITWNSNEKSIKMQEQLKNKGLINFVYDMPWYWKIFISNNKNVSSNQNKN